MENVNWNAIGLLCDIIGAILIFIFGLPPTGFWNRKLSDYEKMQLEMTNKRFNIHEEKKDPEDVKHERKYKIWAHVGILLLIIGFVCQLYSTLSPKTIPNSCTSKNCKNH